MRTFEYRLYPNRAQRQHLMACLIESRAIYNEMLTRLKAQYETDGTFPSKYDLTARFRGRGGDLVPASAVQTLADRLSKALRRYLQLKSLGASVGFPASRRQIAGAVSSCVSMGQGMMCGWMTTANICMCPQNWASY